MSKTRGKFLNLNEIWEINDWLSRNGYRETEDNRKLFAEYVSEVKKFYYIASSENLSWGDLDDYHEKNYKNSLISFEIK